jgi:hypothetical protein
MSQKNISQEGQGSLVDMQDHLPSEEPLSTEGFVEPDPQDVRSLEDLNGSVILNDEGHLEQSLGDNAELAALAGEHTEQAISAKFEEPSTPNLGQVTDTQVKPKSKLDNAVDTIVGTLLKGKKPIIDGAYSQSAIGLVRANQELRAKIQEELDKRGDGVQVADLISEALSEVGGKDKTSANPFNKSLRDARHFVPNRGNPTEGPTKGSRGDTPEITEVDNDQSQ